MKDQAQRRFGRQHHGAESQGPRGDSALEITNSRSALAQLRGRNSRPRFIGILSCLLIAQALFTICALGHRDEAAQARQARDAAQSAAARCLDAASYAAADACRKKLNSRVEPVTWDPVVRTQRETTISW
jgi:hypothetical protein